VHYLGAAYEGDRIEVGTWPVLNDGRLRIDRRFQIRRKSDGQTLVRALVHYVCIDLQTGKPKRMPIEFTKYTVAPAVAEAVARETEPYQPGVEPR
jgi:acyl-CoA thioester hydrolase